jgi:hypothetical protein
MEDGREGHWILLCKHPSSMMVKSVVHVAQRLNANIFLEERGFGEQADFRRFLIYWHKL